MSRRQGFSTTAIHGIPQRRPDWSPVAPAIQQSSTFTNPVGSDEEVLYSRYGNNPNQLALAKKYALLEGTEDAIFTPDVLRAGVLARLPQARLALLECGHEIPVELPQQLAAVTEGFLAGLASQGST